MGETPRGKGEEGRMRGKKRERRGGERGEKEGGGGGAGGGGGGRQKGGKDVDRETHHAKGQFRGGWDHGARGAHTNRGQGGKRGM